MKKQTRESLQSKVKIKNKFLANSKSSFTLICEETLKILSDMENNSLDLIVTSPPYNLGKDYEKDKNFTMKEYFNWQKKIIKLSYKKLKKSGSVCWQVGYNNHIGVGTSREYYPLEYDFDPIFSDAGFIMKNRIIWAFGLGSQNKNNFSTRHEVIMWYTKSADYKFNLDKFTNISGKTGLYVQYAQVRAKRILEKFSGSTQNIELSLTSNEERSLVFALLNIDVYFNLSIKYNEPHHLADYLYEISNLFNIFYQQENILNIEDENLKISRLKITSLFVECSNTVMRCLGINPVNKM